ncbi:MAG: FkbM family methyltransferase [Cyanobacteriota bacterium]
MDVCPVPDFINVYPVLNFVSDVRVILDIGANIGIATAFFRLVYPNAIVYSFEPDPFACTLLRLNALEKGNPVFYPPREDIVYPFGNSVVYSFGLYSEDTEKIFYTGIDTISHSFTHNFLHRSCDFGIPRLVHLKDAHKFFVEAGIDRIDIVKINTGGCEVDILRNIAPRIPSIKIIYVEFHSEQDRYAIDQLLKKNHALVWKLEVNHILRKENTIHPYKGNLCYLNRELIPESLLLDSLSSH